MVDLVRTLPTIRLNRFVTWRLACAVLICFAVSGGVATGIDQSVAFAQQDAEDATAGATGADGTINGRPRESSGTAPVIVTGPGSPLPPPEIMLPPSIPEGVGVAAIEAGTVDPAAPAGAPMAQPQELVFTAIADTTVFSAEPNAPQTAESAGLLAIGGPQGATALISFDVSGIEGATIVSALLTFTGASSSPGGGVGIIYDYVTADGATANDVPGGNSALNFHGAPAWFDRIETGGVSSVDVSGSIFGDGAITFVMQGQPQEQGQIYAIESGIAPQLVITVMQ